MGFLVCDKCGGYYELQEGESPDDFSDECECGGKTRFVETLDDSEGLEELGATIKCPHCGTENPEDAKLCQSCKRFIIPIKSHKTDSKSQPSPPYTPKRGKVSDELIGTWNKQSTPIKALSVLGICCVGIILILAIGAMFFPDKTSTLSSSISPTTSTSAMSESEYRVKGAAWSADMKDVSDGIADVAEGVGSGTTSESDAYSKLNSLQSTNQRVLAEIQTTTPPSKFSNVHKNLLGAVTDTNNAINLIKTGIQAKSTSHLNQALNLIKSATSKVNSANDELEKL